MVNKIPTGSSGVNKPDGGTADWFEAEEEESAFRWWEGGQVGDGGDNWMIEGGSWYDAVSGVVEI